MVRYGNIALLNRIGDIWNRGINRIFGDSRTGEILRYYIGPFAAIASVFLLLCIIFAVAYKKKKHAVSFVLALLSAILSIGGAIVWRIAWIDYYYHSYGRKWILIKWLPVAFVVLIVLLMMIKCIKAKKQKVKALRERREVERLEKQKKDEELREKREAERFKKQKQEKAATGTKHFDSTVAAQRSWIVGVIAGITITGVIYFSTGLTFISVIAGTITVFIVSVILTGVLSLGSSTARNIAFAEECEKHQLHPLETETDFQKMKMVAAKHGFKNKTDEEYRQLYTDGIRMRSENKKIDQNQESAQKLQTGHQKDTEQKIALKKYGGFMYINPSRFDGRAKRYAMLKAKLTEITAELKRKEAYLERMKHPAKSDPYIHGGIASALGGPAAGIMAASDVAASNAKTAASSAALYAAFGRTTENEIAFLEWNIKAYKEAISKMRLL